MVLLPNNLHEVECIYCISLDKLTKPQYSLCMAIPVLQLARANYCSYGYMLYIQACAGKQ